MSVYIDTLPFELFKKLKAQYPTKMILIQPRDLDRPGVLKAYDTPEDYVRAHFMHEHNVEIYRYRHDYKSLDGEHPQLGVVFMANDSVIVPGLEAWVLIGHNAKYAEKPDDVA